MVEADIVERRGRREARDVAAELGAILVRAHDHRHRVPAHERADPVLASRDRPASAPRDRWNRVDVRGRRVERQVRAGAARLVDQPLEQEMRALGTFALEHRLERVEPFAGFLRVDVGIDVLHVHRESPVGASGAGRM